MIRFTASSKFAMYLCIAAMALLTLFEAPSVLERTVDREVPLVTRTVAGDTSPKFVASTAPDVKPTLLVELGLECFNQQCKLSLSNVQYRHPAWPAHASQQSLGEIARTPLCKSTPWKSTPSKKCAEHHGCAGATGGGVAVGGRDCTCVPSVPVLATS
jgi:hypothetical protein